jgi:sec-independent protein translocase protein TatA
MGISVTKLLILLAIIIVVFGTKRLRNMGADLGGAIKGFRTSIKEGESEDEDEKDAEQNKVAARVIDGDIAIKQTQETDSHV